MFRRLLLLAVLLAVSLYISRSLWLGFLGDELVFDQGPAKADVAVVLAGDYNGHRIEKAASLAKNGFVPSILVSGPAGFYGAHECDLAIPFIIREGYPAQWFVPFPHSALSTVEEARVVVPELQRRGVHNFLLVTSDYHTARSARIFRSVLSKTSGAPAMRVVGAPDQYFAPHSWWKNREGRKTAFFEWCKTFATAVGL